LVGESWEVKKEILDVRSDLSDVHVCGEAGRIRAMQGHTVPFSIRFTASVDADVVTTLTVDIAERSSVIWSTALKYREEIENQLV